MQKIEYLQPSYTNLCSSDPLKSWYLSDVTKDSKCICPPDQIQVSKSLGEETIFKCQLKQDQNNPDLLSDSIDASSTRNLSNPNNPNNYNNPLTRNNPTTTLNLYNPNKQPAQITQPQPNPNAYLNINNPNPSFNTATCDETPYSNLDDWSGLSTDSTCNCPYPLTQVKNKINDTNYFTCSWPSNY
jgi:hypothetical protein